MGGLRRWHPLAKVNVAVPNNDTLRVSHTPIVRQKLVFSAHDDDSLKISARQKRHKKEQLAQHSGMNQLNDFELASM